MMRTEYYKCVLCTVLKVTSEPGFRFTYRNLPGDWLKPRLATDRCKAVFLVIFFHKKT